MNTPEEKSPRINMLLVGVLFAQSLSFVALVTLSIFLYLRTSEKTPSDVFAQHEDVLVQLETIEMALQLISAPDRWTGTQQVMYEKEQKEWLEELKKLNPTLVLPE